MPPHTPKMFERAIKSLIDTKTATRATDCTPWIYFNINPIPAGRVAFWPAAAYMP